MNSSRGWPLTVGVARGAWLGWTGLLSLLAGALVLSVPLAPPARCMVMVLALCAGFRLLLYFMPEQAAAIAAADQVDADSAGGTSGVWRPALAGAACVCSALLLPWTLAYLGWRLNSVKTQGVLGVVSLGILQAAAGHWLVALRRYQGLSTESLYRRPLTATGVRDFWSVRWNRSFSRCNRVLVFDPLCRVWGARWATLGAFAFSGVLHELFITWPTGGPYGSVLFYFALQGTLQNLEHQHLRGTWVLANPIASRAWMLLAVIGPVKLLFPAVFLTEVTRPLLQMMGPFS